ncbi:MAG: DsbA family protein [Candidatus Dormiibacterota bacterium]
MEEINFHFDPACPWAWLTSRWAARLAELGELSVNWRFFSLGIVHLEAGSPTSEAADRFTGPSLRLLALARRRGGNDAVGRLYSEIGRAVHGRGESLVDPLVIEAALERAGMDSSWRAEVESDPSLWEEVVADHEAAVASCQAFGVPTIILDSGRGPGAFGPVLDRVPDDQEAKELLRDVVRMLRRGYVFELKRERDGHPPQLATTA